MIMRRALSVIALMLLSISMFSQEAWRGSVQQNKSEVITSGSKLENKAGERSSIIYAPDGTIATDSLSIRRILSENISGPLKPVSRSGVIASRNGFDFFGSGGYNDYPFLLTNRNATLGVSRSFGQVSITATVSANNYVSPGGPFVPGITSTNQFGVGGRLVYAFSDYASIVLFGQFYNTQPFFSMASYPFVNTSRYGGYLDLTGDRFGIEMGAQRYFDPFTNRWEVAPIINPKVRVGDKVFITLPVGGLVKSGMEKAALKKNGPPPPPPQPQRPKR